MFRLCLQIRLDRRDFDFCAVCTFPKESEQSFKGNYAPFMARNRSYTLPQVGSDVDAAKTSPSPYGQTALSPSFD